MVTNKLDAETNKVDLVKWILAGAIFVGALIAFYYLDQYPLKKGVCLPPSSLDKM